MIPAIDIGADRIPPATAARDAALDRLRRGTPIVAAPAAEVSEEAEPESEAPAPETRPAPRPAPEARRASLNDFEFEQVLAFVFSKMKPEQVFERMIIGNKAEEIIEVPLAEVDLTLSVLMFTVEENSISFFVSRKGAPRLKMGVAYTLKRGHETYPVKFVAGFFPSQDFGYGIMSFLRTTTTQ